MSKHISSGAVVYILENKTIKVLIMHRKKSDSWHLPKGSQIEGESLEETALREIKEETGVQVELGKYIGKLDSTFERNGETIEKETHYFLAQPVGEYISFDKHDNEHDEVNFYEYEIVLNHLENFSLHEKEGEILKMAEQVLRQ
ncbi:NUDIX domain-containing protein [Candidatus Nomurabacteria bacterium]|nr:NUDIX domain-containing protein [Candidatus Nomurabacteria bacterium]